MVQAGYQALLNQGTLGILFLNPTFQEIETERLSLSLSPGTERNQAREAKSGRLAAAFNI